ncbi:MAG: T9SS type A sorting domain-containing protein [Saprospiraceae bacterium]|nr:T9SS type A sorting domain-containing protein [Saprospiraceae bacterium]
MKSGLFTFLVTITSIFYIQVCAFAQCNDPFEPGLNCETAPVFCFTQDLDGYCTKLPDFSNPTAPIPMCSGSGGGVPNNSLWLGFVAASNNMDLLLLADNCTSAAGSFGFQAGIYKGNCGGPFEAIACQGLCRTDSINLSTKSLIPGELYYIVLDGCNGSVCDITIELKNGELAPAVLDDPIGPIASKSNEICIGDSVLFSIPPVKGASAYYWTLDEKLVGAPNLMSNSVKLNFTTPGSHQLCVDVANSCFDVSLPPTQQCIDISVYNLTLADADVTSLLCFGDSAGTISITPQGGLAPYSFNWSTGATTPLLDNLKAGNYTVTVSDALSCNKIFSFEINQPDSLQIVVTNTNMTNNNINNGKISVVASGGTAPYTYLWNIGATTTTIDSLGEGIYTVTVTDSKGCTLVQNIFMSGPDCGLSITFAKEHNNCNGGSEGTACVQVVGNFGPYIYKWNGTPGDSCLTNLKAGYYFVTIVNTAGCEVKQFVEIKQPPPITVPDSSITIITESYFGAGDAQVVLSPTNGTAPYSFLFDNGTTDGTLLAAGNHIVTITDANGCTSEFHFNVPAIPCDSLGVQSVDIDIVKTCNNDTVSVSIINISGGKEPYSIHWSNDSTSISVKDLYENITALTVTDSFHCSLVIPLNIVKPAELQVTLDFTHTSQGKSNGKVTAIIKGGEAPFKCLWSTGDTLATIKNLSPGTYCVTIIDAQGCMLVKCGTVEDGTSTNELLSAGWKLFPNPANDFIFLKQIHPDASPISISIYDVEGKELLSTIKQNTSGVIQVDISHLPPGSYYLSLKHKDRDLYAKFLVK